MALSAEERRRRFRSRPSIIYLNEEVDLGCIFRFIDYTLSRTARTVTAGDILQNTNQFVRFLSNNSSGVNTAHTNGMVLPLPKQLVDNFSANVAGKEAGLSGAYLGEMISNAGSTDGFAQAALEAYRVAGDIGRTGADFLNQEPGSAAALGQVAGMTAQLLIRAGVGGLSPGLSAGIDAALASTVNNYQTLTFDGIPLKQHTLNFEFAPETEQQSQNLAAAIQQLKFNSLPAYSGSGEGVLSRALLSYPSLVQIAFWGLDDRFFYKFKPAMISNISVDYTPHGNSLLRGAQGGRPAFVNLSITFVEQSIWTQEDPDWDDFETEGGE